MNQFEIDVLKGLSAHPKSLPSKYFYNEIGDRLFVEIMKMPEYYLTDAELEIFEEQTAEIIKVLDLTKEEPFEIVELGAGDGTKTIELLKVLVAENYKVEYVPIDISMHALDGLKARLVSELPALSVKPRQGDYFEVLSSLKATEKRKIVLFLGSNIGNLLDQRAQLFMQNLSKNLNKNDQLLLGVDLIKSADIVLPAYNDEAGITRKFNLNLLQRMNDDLGANFVIEQFEHCPEYTEEEGIAKSFLKSKTEQTVFVKSLGQAFHFNQGEKIHTEISRKYNDKIIQSLIAETSFLVMDKLVDSRRYFADYVLRRN